MSQSTGQGLKEMLQSSSAGALACWIANLFQLISNGEFLNRVNSGNVELTCLVFFTALVEYMELDALLKGILIVFKNSLLAIMGF